MSNLFVKNIPSIQKREFKYRGRMDSHTLNEMQKEAFDDILDLFNKANQLQKTVYELSMANHIETKCYSERLENALGHMMAIKEQYENMMSQSDYRYQTCYAYDQDRTDIEQLDAYAARVERASNSITSHITNSVSKTRLYDETYDEYLVPPSLQVYVGPDSFRVNIDQSPTSAAGETMDTIYSIEDTDVLNAFDGNDGSVWLRKVKTSADVSQIENEIIIGLPEDIITTRLMNEIILKPFPVGHVDVLDIQYKSNGAWQSIPGFKSHHLCEEEDVKDIFGNITGTKFVAKDAGNMIFSFHAIQTSQLKFKLRQRHYEEEYSGDDARHVFYLGLRDVDVRFNTYTNEHSEFTMTYQFPEIDRSIQIFDAEPLYNNLDVIDTDHFSITKEYFYFDSDGNTHKMSQTCPFIMTYGDTHKLMVKFTVDGGQFSPNIYACRVKYNLVDPVISP